MKNKWARRVREHDGVGGPRLQGVRVRCAPLLGASLLYLVLLAFDAGAASKRYAVDNATWRAECGGCHVPYPPALLPAAEWRRLMSALDRHFGEDASVDATAAAEIDRFMGANAGRGAPRTGETEPRITTTRWFRHEHDEVSAAAFRSARVKSAANCAACHPGAATGNFDERAVAVPR
jgi:cytochrome c553